MPAGLEAILNQHGTVLIDDNYENLAVVEQGSNLNPPSYDDVNMIAFKRNTIEDGTFWWWKFGTPTYVGSDNAALQVFNAAGQIRFDSRMKYARVVDVFAGPTSEAVPVTRTYPSGRSYAVVTSKSSHFVQQEVRNDPDSPAGWYNYRRRFWVGRVMSPSNVVTASWYAFPWTDWSLPIMVVPSPHTDDRVSRYIVLDVTNY